MKNSIFITKSIAAFRQTTFCNMNRYSRNEQMLSREENLRLRGFRIAIVGCGGLGGYLIEQFARLGIGHLSLIDGDVFDETNLNRQLLSHPGNLGQPKAMEAKQRVSLINPDVTVEAHHVMLEASNAASLLQDHDLVCDALDNISSRYCTEQAAEALRIPMIHAAIAGWHAQVATIMPGDKLLEKIYPVGGHKGAETVFGNPSFTPALAASLQVAEALKVLLNKEGVLRNKILVINLLDHQYEVVDLP